MTEVVVIISLIVLIGWQEYHNRKERAKLVNAILSKSVNDFKELELADRTDIKIRPPKEPNLIATDNLSDDEWFEKEIKPKK